MRRRYLHHLIGAVPQVVIPADPSRPHHVPIQVSAIVVGGGIAGSAAAVVLAERGVRVTLLEAEPRLGGRAAAWPLDLPDGTTQMVEHGFHAFFRQYYNLRALLRRVDPDLSFLRAVPDYPIVSRRWPDESFARLPTLPPFGLLPLLVRSPSIRLRDLRAMDGAAALPLLAYDRERTYAEYDGRTAAELLDLLRLPDRARAMLFDVFSHSFFNHERDMSAAELIMMFHFYFLGNPEGLLFDVPDRDYETCIWAPLARHLAALHADVRTSSPVEWIEATPHGEWRVHTAGRDSVQAPHLVLATDPGALQALAGRSPGLMAAGRGLSRQIASLRTTAPYAVARFWFDGDVAAHRQPFSGVTRESTLDSIAVYSRFEREAADWAERTGGSVVELHGYAVPAGVSAEELALRMRSELAGLWPESADLGVVHSDARLGDDAPGFGPGSDSTRPGVTTDAAGVRLAGDWVRLGFPSALMERAAASGMLAAGDILTAVGAAPEPVLSVPGRGLLARRQPGSDQA
ncbi:MAG: FAD-dependent oxidoreductase [Mycobacteriales bacterium]